MVGFSFQFETGSKIFIITKENGAYYQSKEVTPIDCELATFCI
jgi:hypothetical protein